MNLAFELASESKVDAVALTGGDFYVNNDMILTRSVGSYFFEMNRFNGSITILEKLF